MQSIWSCQRAFDCWLHLPDAPSGCPKRSEGGSPATARRKCVGASLTKQVWRSQQKDGEGDSPPPASSSLCRYRARKPRPYGTGAECFTCGRRDGVLRNDIRMRSGACVTKQARRSQQKDGEGGSPPPPPVRYAGIARASPALTELALSVLHREREGWCPPQ